MRVAVVILNWNGELFLKKFLPSVIQHSANATIYVADNASTDGSVQLIRSDFPTVRLIILDQNFGFAGGYNEALKDLNEEYFVLLNSDVDVTANWLDPILDLMDADPSIAACQPKVLKYDQPTHFEYAGAAGGFVDKFGYPFCRGRIFDSVEADEGQYDTAMEVFWATGACMFVRSKIYEQLGGLDADFFAHMEEIDFCWRSKRAGYRILVQPESVVYHVGGGTLNQSNPRKTFLNFRNGLELLVKNLPKSILIQIILIRLLLDGVAGLKFLLSGRPKDLWAIVRAHFAFYGRLRSTLTKRSGNYKNTRFWYRKSVVFQFMVMGRKKFSELPQDGF